MRARLRLISFVSLLAALAPSGAQAQHTAALMPEVQRPAGFTEAQVETVRQAARRALRGISYRVLDRREVASRLATGTRCRSPDPCLGPAHAALGVDLVVHISITGAPGAPRVRIQITDGSTHVNHGLSGTPDRLPAIVHETVLRAARRLQLGGR